MCQITKEKIDRLKSSTQKQKVIINLVAMTILIGGIYLLIMFVSDHEKMGPTNVASILIMFFLSLWLMVPLPMIAEREMEKCDEVLNSYNECCGDTSKIESVCEKWDELISKQLFIKVGPMAILKDAKELIK